MMKTEKYRRRSLGALVFVVLALTDGCTPAASVRQGQADAARTLRVMSYNIHAGTGGLERIAGVIRQARPDIVGLQEVDVHFSPRSSYVDQAAALADMLAMHVRFAHIYELEPDSAGAPAREYGVALLSRYPITAFHNHVIPRLSTVADEPEPRPRPGFLEARIDVDGTDVRVFNTHLDYRGNPRVRRMQVAAMLRIIGPASTPTLLTGDLNAQPYAPELQPLLDRLRDAWTGSTLAGLTFPATEPTKRIDYVLHSGHFDADSTRVRATDASDHLPVIVDLTLRPPD